MNHRAKFFVMGTKLPNGKSTLINAKEAPDMITAMKASMALPGLYGKVITVDRCHYIDGDFSDPFPVKEIVRRFRPTDLLVIDNRTQEVSQANHRPLAEKIGASLMVMKMPKIIWRETVQRQSIIRKL